MKQICIGDKFQIHCYKHDGKIHRNWNEAIVLDIRKDYMVFGNNKTLVTESNGNSWRTKEPAIMYFFKNSWFNIIVQIKNNGIYYYCNIATPYIIEDNTIKYIDYDLDLRIFPDGEYKILDAKEYQYHKKIMNYSQELDIVINNALKELIEIYTENGFMFDKKINLKYCESYKELTN